MHLIGLVVLALLVGWLQAFLAPKVSTWSAQILPASWQAMKVVNILVNGLLILFVLVVATFALREVGLQHKKVA